MKRFLKILISSTITILISFIFCILLLSLSFYVHEGGHIYYGTITNLMDGTIPKYEISDWSEMPILKIPIPKQTTIYGLPTMGFIFGGITLIILTSTAFSIIYFKKSKNKNRKFIFLIPILFSIHEFFGNFLCETDNLKGIPFNLCENFKIFTFITTYIFIPLTITISILIWNTIEKYINKFF